jgi:hypothetical protein
MARLALLLAVVPAVVAPGVAAGHAPAGTAGVTDAAGKCARHLVGTLRICLRKGQRCDSGLQHDYLKAHLECHGRRLRPASLAALREGEPLLLDGHGRISRQIALEAFSSKVARLPGVKVRPGAVGQLSDATGVIDAVEAQRSHLTTAQRKAIDRALTPRAQVAATTQDLLDFRTIASQAEQRLAAHGFPLTHRVFLAFPSTNTLGGNPGKDLLGYAAPGWLDQIAGVEDRCVVWITPLGVGSNEAKRREIVAHELFHCAQFEFYNGATNRGALPQWVVEGSATWVGGQIAREWNGFDTANGHWSPWLLNPELDLGRRDYDAIGFYSLLQQSGDDVFARLHRIIPAAASGGDGSAYAAAIELAPAAFFNTWGPGFARSRVLPPNWDLTGPGILYIPAPHTVINQGTNAGRAVDQRGAEGRGLSLEADVIGVQADVSHGRIYTSAGDTPLRTELLCTKSGGCACPDGAPLPGRQVSKGIAAVGWQGGGASFTGESVDAACQKTGHGGGTPPSGPTGNVCRILKAIGITAVIPGGAFAAVLNSCTYGKCFSHYNDAGQQKCALLHAGTLVVQPLGSRAAARAPVNRLLASGAFRRVAIGADVAAIATKPSGGVIAMAVGTRFATLDLGASSDHPGSKPAWHNTGVLTQLARRLARRL